MKKLALIALLMSSTVAMAEDGSHFGIENFKTVATSACRNISDLETGDQLVATLMIEAKALNEASREMRSKLTVTQWKDADPTLVHSVSVLYQASDSSRDEPNRKLQVRITYVNNKDFSISCISGRVADQKWFNY